MKKHLGTLLILIGIGIIAIPLVGRFLANQRQEALMADYLEQVNNEVDANDIADLNEGLDWGAREGNQDELNIGVNEAVADALEFEETGGDGNLADAGKIKQKPKAIGVIEIPKIGIKLPVAEGADLATLKFSLGHMPNTAGLGSIGNAVVAGHRSHSFGSFFNRLDEVEVGDVINVYAGGKTYKYDVYTVKVVEPDDLSVLGGSNDHRILTLITCTPLYTSTHRLIVHAVVREDEGA